MFWKPNLTTKVTSPFLLLSLLSLAVVGGVTFFKAREDLKQAAFQRLQVTATLKEEEIGRWFADRQRDFVLITQFPDVQANLKIFLSHRSNDPDNRKSYAILSDYLQKITQAKPNLQEIFVLDRTNRIVLSSERYREGNYEVLANITYVRIGESADAFAPIFYVSPLTGKPAVTLATPLYDRAGIRQGIILAHLNLDRIDQIVRERTGLGQSGETYLVGSLVTKNTFIAKEPAIVEDFPEGISSKGIDDAMQGLSGSGLYRNYAKVPVIGVYRWLNDQDLALLVEMQQQEAFAPARQLAITIVLVGLASVGVLMVGISWLSRQLALSQKKLEDYSHQLEGKAKALQQEIRDRTAAELELTRAEEAMRHAKEAAEKANQSKSEFLANMSHELRTPLNAILGFTQIMTRDVRRKPLMPLEQHQETLEIVGRSGEHLLALINDVLSMAKIESGKLTLQENSFDLYHLLDTLEAMLRLKATTKDLHLQFSIASDIPQYIYADESKLRQVLINLLGNAIKFTQKGNVILRVTTPSPPHPSLNFEVEDTGPGITPEEIDRLFEAFVQTTSGRDSNQGTGLGLAISRQFVRLMGGEIDVDSVFGQGTTFKFTIPLKTGQKTIADRSSYENIIGLAPNQPGYRILIVEDKWENRQLLLRILEPLGFEVREAENGREGIEIWQSWRPHLIWMDMRMPVMDGYEATQFIKDCTMGHATVIIALTASAFEEKRSLVLSAGCDDFVRKPFKSAEIFEKMAVYLGVRYLYTEGSTTASPSGSLPPPFVLTADALKGMPPEWISQLHQAATQANEDLILQLLEQVPPSQETLQQALTDLIDNLQFEQIIKQTQKAIA